jgi:hypothetical protein
MELRSKSDVSPVESLTSVSCNSVTLMFSSISKLSHLIRDFHTFKIGPEVVLAARWRPKAEMASRLDYSSREAISKALLEFFIYLLPFKRYSSVLNWLEIWHSGSKAHWQ